ncbi:MAG: cytochrome P460 family protein [Alphaproteobacteria bacterium]
MKRLVTGLVGTLLLAAGFSALAWAGPKFDAGGKLVIPADTLRWPAVATTFALSYEGDGGTSFNTVRMDPKSYDTFLKTGKFPVGTMLDLEIRKPLTEVAPAKGGNVEGPALGHSIHVKDEKAGPGTWTFYAYTPGGTGSAIARDKTCYSCHQDHAKDDTVFTQFYPALVEARAKVAAAH